MTELDRIKKAYQARIRRDVVKRYSMFLPGELYMLQRREEETLQLLRQQGVTELDRLRILEIGCGRGSRLVDWIRWGASASLLCEIDLMETFIRDASRTVPAAKLVVGSADQLPYQDHCFDIVVQLTVFSSILDLDIRRAVAREMMRVLTPAGLIIWYDFRYPSLRNPDVHSIGLSELQQLFPGRKVNARSMTLLPPLTRKLAQVSFAACRALETLPPLRSHYLAAIRRK